MSAGAVLVQVAVIVALPTLAGLSLMAVGSRHGRQPVSAWIAAGAAAVAALLAVRLVAWAATGGASALPVGGQHAWLTSDNVAIAVGVHVDGAALALLLLTTVVPMLVLVHRASQPADVPDAAPAAVLLHAAALGGLGVASGLIPLVTFWLLGGLAAAVLVATGQPRATALAAGRGLFLAEVVGVMGLGLAAVICRVVCSPADPFSPATTPLASAWPAGPMRSLAGAGLLLAAAARASQLPLAWWLPRGGVAPASARAVLLSGMHGASGLVLLLRFNLLMDMPVRIAALTLGGTTAFVLACVGLAQTSRSRAVGSLAALSLAAALSVLGAGGDPRTVLVLLLSQTPALAVLALVTEGSLIGRRGTTVAWVIAATVVVGMPGTGGFLAWRDALGTLFTESAPLLVAFVVLWLSRVATVAVLVRWWLHDRMRSESAAPAAPAPGGALMALAIFALASLLWHGSGGGWLSRLLNADPQASLFLPPPLPFWLAAALPLAAIVVGALLGWTGRTRSPAEGWPWPPALHHVPARLRLMVAGPGPLAAAMSHALTTVARAVAGCDRVVAVGIVDGCGWIVRVVARMVMLIDQGLTRLLTEGTELVFDRAGAAMQRVQTGRLRDGMIVAVAVGVGVVLVMVAR